MNTVINRVGDLYEEGQAVHNAKERHKNTKENSKFHKQGTATRKIGTHLDASINENTKI